MQLILPLHHDVDFSAPKWVVGPGNQEATQAVLSWPQWPHSFLCVHGPKGVGKSHLAHIWHETSHAEVLDTATCDTLTPHTYKSKAYLLEGAHTIKSQEWFFHFYNKIIEDSAFCLLTSNTPPAQWSFTLPDLMSRLKTIPVAQLHPMDDDLLKCILEKQFLDQGFLVQDVVFSHILTHLDRSLSILQAFTAFLIQQANHEGRKINLPFVKHVMTFFPKNT